MVHGYLDPFNKDIDDKAQNMYDEQYLTSVRAADFQGKTFILSNVSAEKRVSISYRVDIVLDSMGVILECQCECAVGMAPNAHCKHVLCVCLGLLAFTKNGEITTRETCTQKLQTFHFMTCNISI